MEVTEILASHSMLVKIFLGFLVLGLAIPFMGSTNIESFKKSSFIYTMIFQAIATAIAVLGFLAIFEGNLGWKLSSIIMIVVWALMMMIEIKKHKSIKNASNEDLAQMKSKFTKTSIIEILFVAAMVVMMILKAKGIISI